MKISDTSTLPLILVKDLMAHLPKHRDELTEAQQLEIKSFGLLRDSEQFLRSLASEQPFSSTKYAHYNALRLHVRVLEERIDKYSEICGTCLGSGCEMCRLLGRVGKYPQSLPTYTVKTKDRDHGLAVGTFMSAFMFVKSIRWANYQERFVLTCYRPDIDRNVMLFVNPHGQFTYSLYEGLVGSVPLNQGYAYFVLGDYGDLVGVPFESDYSAITHPKEL